jgi:diguanylate cyclase (GGDEF)-like protein
VPVAPELITVAAVIAVLVLIALVGLIVPRPSRRRGRADDRPVPPPARPAPARQTPRAPRQAAPVEQGSPSRAWSPVTEAGVPTRTYERVVRIVAWVFLLTTAATVAITGLWPDTQAAVFVLLAVAGLFIIVVHELLPAGVFGPSKFTVEGSMAITVATLLVALTGGVASPFFFAFLLIVGGAALVVAPRVTAVLTAAAAAAYLAAILVGSAPGWIGPSAAAVVAVNLVALILLAYVATVIARAQRHTRDEAIRLSTIDSLTGLYNRSHFFAAIDREIARSARSSRGFCLLMMDLDELKAINDQHGHFYGDRVLKRVGEVISQGVRLIDTPARYGGDEFVVLLPETDPTGAFVLAEKIRLGVGAMTVELPAGAARPSLSIGVVSYPEDGLTADQLIISADGAMYASKHAGKDRVTGYPITAMGRQSTPV